MSPVDSDEELTRKQRREQARAERKALEEQAQASTARRKRLTQLGVVAAAVVVAVVVVLIASGGSSKNTPPPKKGGNPTLVRQVESEIGGIPQQGFVLGSPSAPVTLRYFGDLECPVCREFTLGALPTVISKWVRTGKLRIEYRSLETATREPEVFKTQQVAALATGKQQKMWQYIELFYRQQGEEGSGYVTESFLQGLAQQVPGLNLTQWASDRNAAGLASQVTVDAQEANTVGFTSTPAFLVGRTGGAMKKLEYTSLSDPKPFNEAVEKLVKA